MDAFSVWRSMRAVPTADHTSHLEGVSPSSWQATPYERVGKAAEGGRDLACRGITFVTPDGASRLIDTSRKIAEVVQLLFPILVGQATSFEETLDWLQFAYTAERTGAYVAPVSMVLVPSAVLEGDPLFIAFWQHRLRRFPGAYTTTPTTHGPLGPDYLGYPKVVPTPTTLAPLGPDYFNGSPGDPAPERRDHAGGNGGGDKHRNTNIQFNLG